MFLVDNSEYSLEEENLALRMTLWQMTEAVFRSAGVSPVYDRRGVGGQDWERTVSLLGGVRAAEMR